MTKEQRLLALHRRATCYEIAAICDERKLLIAYAGAHSRHGILKACRNRGEAIIAVLGLTDKDLLMPCAKASDGFMLGPWHVRFTGRTEREAIISGDELPYVGDLAKGSEVQHA